MSLLDTADVSDPAGPTHPLLSAKELRYAQVLSWLLACPLLEQ